MYLTDNPVDSKLAVIADVGRRAVRLCLTDHQGQLRPETLREYEPSEQSTISGALSAFGGQSELRTLPRRCAVAVSGPTVGDIISVTNSRWFVSRSGLSAMLQAPPLILNDFAAKAWAISAAESGSQIETIAGASLDLSRPGTRCLIGVGSGLGVAVITRDARGAVSVLPTEAGHCHFPGDIPELREIMPRLRAKGAVSAEDMISERGLFAIYQAVITVESGVARATDAAGVIRLALSNDALARKAADLFCHALWHFAGNMALAFGAWDGIMFTGGVANALRGLIRLPELSADFVVAGPYQRQLREIPRALVTLDHAELYGAARALLLQ
ncbi:glucokinase [Sphingomonas sp. LB-2]|uniref:glucokinase n=1 Tax=Sphingomonas caeni TaxID=2984949 RepID=UPI002232AFE7|nr:glucokinase [Sphingomonas caeni]MCW3846080.1 glucokinase [Sphingomonas caeni]